MREKNQIFPAMKILLETFMSNGMSYADAVKETAKAMKITTAYVYIKSKENKFKWPENATK